MTNCERAARDLPRADTSRRSQDLMEVMGVCSDGNVYVLQEFFQPPEGTAARQVVQSNLFMRKEWEVSGRAALILDQFSDAPGASCCFVRLQRGPARIVRFVVDGAHTLASCPSGGWLIKSAGEVSFWYWVPQSPVLRTIDSRERILSERAAAVVGVRASSADATIEIEVPNDSHLDCVFWRLPPDAADLVAGLERPLVLEMQPVFMWGSHTAFRGPADMYRYLIHGHVYENRFEWRRKWKTCAENEAYSIYVTLLGLELATGKSLYGLLKRQILFSVIARQSADGGWHHGEWSDFMESHYRLHNGAVLLLEAALEERPDDAVRSALANAAAYTSRHTDQTSLGLWFLHDSLEENLDLLHRSGSRLIPSRVLGKSPATKMILNTHLDAIVALDRYREVTGDNQYGEHIASARATTRALLALRPAEALYRFVYWAVRLALLPAAEAQQRSVALRALRRVAREYLLPRLHKIKRTFPRMVMPGGLIERHLSMPHFDINYQTVNIMDLVRLWRRFPDEDFADIVGNAVKAVRETSLLRMWTESKQRQALGYWLEALYQLCTLGPAPEYRQYLAEAILIVEDLGLGLPPSLLGANPEVVRPEHRIRCPSPTDSRIRVANLSCGGKREFLAVNCSSDAIELSWERKAGHALTWSAADGQASPAGTSPIHVPPRGWLSGADRV
jgi:hypothetical protein